METVGVDNSDRTEEEIIEELTEIFSCTYASVNKVDPFDNDDHLAAWVTLEEGDELGFTISQDLREEGYYISNHSNGETYEDTERQSYLVILEDY